MARLHEYQGKAILTERGIAVPEGAAASSPQEARAVAERLCANGGGVVVKVQAWTTSRKAQGGVKFASSPDEVEIIARDMLAMTFGNFPVSEVLVEEQIDIRNELFISLTIDDAAQQPLLLLDLAGGSGIEERADTVARFPIDVRTSIDAGAIQNLLAESTIEPEFHEQVVRAIVAIVDTAQQVDARSLEINPLVTTNDGRVIAADCRMTIDDYAVFRHPELGIEIARELDHPPTELEKIAYAVEEADHRGTFYFAQLEVGIEASRHRGIEERHEGTEAQRHEGTKARRHEVDSPSPSKGEGRGGGPADCRLPTADSSPVPAHQAPSTQHAASGGLIGFHGAGGGGSMMSMDAVTNEGFTLANFCDTSGNPSAAKVYRAARIILAQPGLVGYFGSGSGVASQEQFWSAYGLAKAFIEMNLSIPAVIRLGGNSEDRAVEILEDACKDLPAKVEGYKKDDTPAFCAQRFAELVAEHPAPSTQHSADRHIPAFVGSTTAYSFPIGGGRVWIDHESCDDAATDIVIAHSFDLLKRDESTGKPILAVSEDDIAGKDSEMIALEVECRRAGVPVVFVDLPIEGLDSLAGP